MDNPANAAIFDTSIRDNNDAISEKSLDNDDHTDNDDSIPIDEIEEPLTPINNSDASDTSSNFDDAPLIRIIDRYPDPFPLSSTPFLPQRMLTNFSHSNTPHPKINFKNSTFKFKSNSENFKNFSYLSLSLLKHPIALKMISSKGSNFQRFQIPNNPLKSFSQ